jgi:hypothetical protein
MELATAPGLPGLSTISEMGGLGGMGADHTSLSELTSYAESLNREQAFTEAIRSSRTDMLAAVPAQEYIEDTRISKWTMTTTSQGFAPQGEVTAYLSSAQCVDLQSTRMTGSCSITFPAGTAGAANYFVVPTALPLMLMTYGVQIGQNGNVLQDPGTATDQCWLTQMRLAKRPFNESDLVYSSTRLGTVLDGKALSYTTEPNAYTSNATVNEVTIPSGAAAQTLTFTFTIRPPHSFFGIEKTWPPNLPLKMIVRWNPSNTAGLIGAQGTAVDQLAAVEINVRVDYIRTEEIYLVPEMRTYIMNHFETGPGTNLDQRALARTMNKAALFDPTFGIPQYNAADVGAIFQFDAFRLSSHAVNGTQWQIMPVLNGSARPTTIVIAIPNPDIPYTSALAPQPGCTLNSLQVLYNGQTIWDSPFVPVADVGNNMEPLYAESKRNADADTGTVGPLTPWWNYESWKADHSWIVVKIAPSHNRNEIQPFRSAPVEIRGTFTTPVPAGMNIRVGLFFNQTMLLQKNNTAIFSLPIY